MKEWLRRLIAGNVTRVEYAVAGVVMFAVKYPIDAFVASRFSFPWSPLSYVSPRLSPLLQIQQDPAMWLTLLAVAVPFVVLGVVLTIGRLRDVGLGPVWSLLFFLPFVNLVFFLVLAALPPRPEVEKTAEPENAGPYRADAAPGEPETASSRRSLVARFWPNSLSLAILLAVLLSTSFSTACVLVAQWLANLGALLFLVVPSATGAICAFVISYRRDIAKRSVFAYVTIAVFAEILILLGLGLEGAVCVLFALPILVPMALVGVPVGVWLARRAAPWATPAISGLAIVPFVLLLGGVTAPTVGPERMVETVVHVNAPAHVVWDKVVAFPPIGEDNLDTVFALGIPRPLSADIRGEGVGAVRNCRFSNGPFVEPIEVWKPGRELTFGVSAQPDDMKAYIDVTRGQFLLEPQPDGTTILRGRTFYRVKLGPRRYWQMFTDHVLHKIHLRVLNHVSTVAEHAAGAPSAR